MSATVRQFLPQPENACFGCGGANQHGMKLAFEADLQTRRVTGRFRIGDEFQGSMGILHGGIIAVLLDEAMGKLCRLSDVRAVTAELNVEYLRPIHVDQEIVVEAFEQNREGRQMYHQGEIRDAGGKVLARGRGRFVVIDPARLSKRS
ncbi:MAG TPA: PaaI family thioesterase [Candidatus Limnocylindrales bacterium]|nr:PaaI family thioesterase [Candidatus Limnocylindrales bacterium]